MIFNNDESHTIAGAAAEAFGRENDPGVDRLAAAIAQNAPRARPCLECGELTTGSVGAAGLRWPALCQPCKDGEDAAAMLSLAGKHGIDLALAAKQGYVFPTAEQMRDPNFVND